MTTIDLSEPDPSSRRMSVFGVWTLLALTYAAILHYQIALPFEQAFATAAVYFYTLALLMIPVRRWSAKLLASTGPIWRQIAAHLGLGLLTLAAWQAIQLLFFRLVIGPQFWNLVYAESWLFQLLSSAAIYGAAIGLTLASLAIARDRERTRRQHELEVAARDAELLALKAQFQPHFVLNALNSLLALIDSDPALARTMVVRLADLMKSVFERADLDLVPLERELDLVRAYLDVERIRLGTRLSVSFDVEDAARGVLVPPFLLQPVVENAVKHGVAPFAGPGRVAVTALVADRLLRVTVRDHAVRPNHSRAPVRGTGRGLLITRRRLDGAYGERYQMTFATEADGASVAIELPAERLGAA
jgi:two-component system, LytTR family, sensor kinase